MNDALTILMIDDESAMQKILRQYFKDKHEVMTHNNGREALIWLYQGNLPDIIIADINMPILNGQDFIAEIKSSGLFCDIPLIMLIAISVGALVPIVVYNFCVRMGAWWLFSLKKPEAEIQFYKAINAAPKQ